MAVTLRELCLKEACELDKELAATADLWIREGVQPDEIPFVLLQVARIFDLILQAFEPASDSLTINQAVLLNGARDAVLPEVADGC
jgi:hypothetical protein